MKNTACSRRQALKALGAVAIATSVVTKKIEHAFPVHASTTEMFDFSEGSITLFEQNNSTNSSNGRKSALNGTSGWQSFSFDNTHGKIYYLQNPPGVSYATSSLNGDLLLSYIYIDGTRDNTPPYMLLNGFGHGESLIVEPIGSDIWIWMECKATLNSANSTDAFGHYLCRFKWASSNHGPFTFSDLGTTALPGSAIYKLPLNAGVQDDSYARSILPAGDLTNDRLLLRYLTKDNNGNYTVPNLAIYSLSDVKTYGNNATQLYHQPQMTLQPDNSQTTTGTLQGIAVYGDYAYLLSGAGKSGIDGIACDSQTAQPTYLYRQNMLTDTTGYATTAAGLTLPYREPEGMSVQIVSGAPRLCFGLISYLRGSQGCATGGKTGGTKFANVFYKEKLIAGA